jgi:hypothetical protein
MASYCVAQGLGVLNRLFKIKPPSIFPMTTNCCALFI